VTQREVEHAHYVRRRYEEDRVTPAPQFDRPLRGLRVVDTTDETAWTSARLLADLGADVIRVDRRPRPVDALYATRHANKRSVLFEADAELLDLLSYADIWFDTVTTGLDVGAVRRALPELVVVSITPFGLTGPYRRYAVTHPVVYALCGQLAICRLPDRAPLLPPGQLAFEVASAMAAYSALVAVWHRALTGRGDHLDLSIHEAMIQTTDTGIAGASVLQAAPDLPVTGAAQSGGVGHPAFPTADGLVRPLVVSHRQWVALREWVGDPPHLRDAALDTYGGRNQHPDVMAAIYRDLFAGTSTEAICEEAQKRNVPVTPVMSPAQLIASEPMQKRGTFAHTVVGGREAEIPAGYWEFDDQRVGFRDAAPVPGADTVDVRAAMSRGESPFSASPFEVPTRAAAGQPPLAGLRVLEFTQLMAGPETGKLLRDHGADVIRVESRAFPDQSRVFGGEANMSSQFVTINRNKRSLGIDLRSSEGRALILRLVAASDVVIENLGPGAMDGLGLDVETLRGANPDLVSVSSQLFGDKGPWGWWRGFGTHARSVGAQTWLWRYPDTDRDFAENPIFFPDQFAARLGALAVLACVGDRGGRHIRVSQADAVINHLAELVLQESIAPRSAGARGNRSDVGAPWGVYRCAGDDRWCVITVRDDTEWSALADASGHPEWATEARFADAANRHRHHDELDLLVNEWTAQLGADEVMQRLQAVRVPAARVVSAGDLLDNPHLQAHDFLRVILQPGWEPLFVEGDCYRADELPPPPAEPAPRQGEHTREIARDLLGLDDTHIDRLIESGVLEVDGL
jgi:crotonobetainyl-CoA:carnitine CoA-transferase CaiB-like acyl-CoA transferase